MTGRKGSGYYRKEGFWLLQERRVLAMTGRRVLAMTGNRCGSRKVRVLAMTGRKGSVCDRKEGFWL